MRHLPNDKSLKWQELGNTYTDKSQSRESDNSINNKRGIVYLQTHQIRQNQKNYKRKMDKTANNNPEIESLILIIFYPVI